MNIRTKDFGHDIVLQMGIDPDGGWSSDPNGLTYYYFEVGDTFMCNYDDLETCWSDGLEYGKNELEQRIKFQHEQAEAAAARESRRVSTAIDVIHGLRRAATRDEIITLDRLVLDSEIIPFEKYAETL